MSGNGQRSDWRPDPRLQRILSGTNGETPSPPRLALTRQEAAGAIGISVDSFERHIQPTLRCNYIGSKRIYSLRDIQAWLDRNAVSP